MTGIPVEPGLPSLATPQDGDIWKPRCMHLNTAGAAMGARRACNRQSVATATNPSIKPVRSRFSVSSPMTYFGKI